MGKKNNFTGIWSLEIEVLGITDITLTTNSVYDVVKIENLWLVCLCNKVETGSTATFDVQKVSVCLFLLVLCIARGKTTLTDCTNSNLSYSLSSKPMSSFVNPGTQCSFYFASFNYLTSLRKGRERTATYLGDQTAAGEGTWQYKKAS